DRKGLAGLAVHCDDERTVAEGRGCRHERIDLTWAYRENLDWHGGAACRNRDGGIVRRAEEDAVNVEERAASDRAAGERGCNLAGCVDHAVLPDAGLRGNRGRRGQ